MAKLLGRSKSLKQARKDADHEEWPRFRKAGVPEDRPATATATSRNVTFESPSPSVHSAKPYASIGMNSSTSSLVRPKTAGANETGAGKRNWAELTATGAPIILNTAEDTFKFPTPVRKPVQTSSPALRSFDMGSETSSGIGIAIGSPSQPSFFSPTDSSKWASSSQDVSLPVSPRPVRANTTKESMPVMDGARPKLSRWKSLGGLFGRKRTGSPAPRNLRDRTLIEIDATKKEAWQLQSDVGVTTTISSISSSGSDSLSSPRNPKKTKRSLRGRKGVTVETTVEPVVIEEILRPPQPPPKPPVLQVDIPDVKLERYSVMFSDVLPRSSSLLVRRQQGLDRSIPLGGASLKPLDVPQSKLVRRATVPSPTPSPGFTLFPKENAKDQKQSTAPHISTLYRPRPLIRSQTAPPALPSPNPSLRGQLSPAFEVDELELEDNEQGHTPSPSSPASPSTPKFDSHEHSLPRSGIPAGHKSWASTQDEPEPSWEMITIGKAMESGDLLDDELLHEDDIDDEEWLAKCKPQVAIARSMSVTKASKRVKLKPVLLPRVENRGNTPTLVDNTPPAKTSVTAPSPEAKQAEMKNELRKEIFGDRGIGKKDEKIVQRRILTPRMHHVVDEGARKSVWGQIETI